MNPTHLAKHHWRVNPEIIRIPESKLADPRKPRLTLVLPDALHVCLERSVGKVRIEALDKLPDLFALLGHHGGDGTAFVGDRPVVLMCSTEMSARG